MKKVSHVRFAPVSTTCITEQQKGIYKGYLVLPLLFCCLLSAAQFKQDVALQRSSIPHTATADASSAILKSKAITIHSIRSHLKKKLSKKSTVTKGNQPTPAEKIVLHAERLDEEQVLLHWNATVVGRNTTYIIERRLGNAHGAFDSVGTVTGRSTDPAAQAYRLVDENTFKGNTFYRLRQSSLAEKESGTTSAMVSSGNRGLQVSAGPAPVPTITITLHQFKIAPRTHLYITDAHGSLVYQKKNVFFSTANTIELTGVQLPKGTYSIEVTNHYNTGVNTIVIR